MNVCMLYVCEFMYVMYVMYVHTLTHFYMNVCTYIHKPHIYLFVTQKLFVHV